MKMSSVFFMFFVSLSAYSQTKAGVTPLAQRSGKIINSNWTFNYFPSASAEKGYESPGFDDSKWSAVSIPHTWNTFETTGELPRQGTGLNSDMYWFNGWGWYRKHFTINQAYSDRKVFIEFEGVRDYCKVWINGVYLGDHKGCYGAFDFDVTSHVKNGADNVIAVAVKNSQSKGDYYLYGGICRDVSITMKNKLYIPMQGSASHEGGTFITTRGIEEKSAVVKIRTWIRNDNEQSRSCTLQTTIYDKDGKIIQQVRSTADIKQDQLYTFDQTSKPVKNPHLWSPEDPYLYTIVSEVYDGKTVVDSYTSPLGFRWFKWDYNENCLYLNGKKTPLRPGGSQNDYPWLGDALPGWLRLMDFTGLAGNRNFNFFRTDHCQNCKVLYDVADREGMIIEEEVPDASPETSQQVVREIIRRNRNHPSVLIRSMENMDAGSESLVAEDTTRILKTGSSTSLNTIPSETASNIIASSTSLPMNGEPARIILSLSHDRFTADRASVAIINANIVDSGGKPVSNAETTLKWIVTGPAKLIGPAIYKSGLYAGQGTPVVNVIRSTGEAGIIKIKVLAAGLASGSLELKSETVVQDNSVISEQVLRNEGRTGVERIVLRPARLEEVPHEIKPVADVVRLSGRDRTAYKKAIREFVAGNNSSADTSSIEFRTLIDVLTAYLYNNKGVIDADDYNYNAGHFNLTRLIAGYINATKLPQPFKDGLRIYYSYSVIKDGDERNAGDEMNWLNWIPSGGTVVYCGETLKTPVIEGTLVSSKNELTDLIKLVHPQFSKFSEEAKVRAVEFITKMNPYVHPDSQTEIINGNKITTTRLLAEKGKPILIPLYKFIAE